jgi:hypothetical protein
MIKSFNDWNVLTCGRKDERSTIKRTTTLDLYVSWHCSSNIIGSPHGRYNIAGYDDNEKDVDDDDLCPNL